MDPKATCPLRLRGFDTLFLLGQGRTQAARTRRSQKNIYKNKTFIQSLIKFNFNIQDIFKLKSLYNYILSNNIFNKNLEDISTNFNSRPIEISIIIPVYNKWNYTVSCIKSIFDQDLKYTFEVIIMDDNSIDLTFNITDSEKFYVETINNVRMNAIWCKPRAINFVLVCQNWTLSNVSNVSVFFEFTNERT